MSLPPNLLRAADTAVSEIPDASIEDQLDCVCMLVGRPLFDSHEATIREFLEDLR